MSKLTRKFFDQKTELVAKQLLGKVLVKNGGGKKRSGIIVETEAYVGPHDLACHASKGKTNRTSAMFSASGYWYIYLIYGVYYCLNIVTEKKGYPAAVLIRAVEPLCGIPEMKQARKTQDLNNLASGPGKLCQAFGIDKTLNCASAISEDAVLYVEDRGITVTGRKIAKTTRVGVDYAGPWKDKLLRFYIKENPFVSKSR